jgi:hypothetical protein
MPNVDLNIQKGGLLQHIGNDLGKKNASRIRGGQLISYEHIANIGSQEQQTLPCIL